MFNPYYIGQFYHVQSQDKILTDKIWEAFNSDKVYIENIRGMQCVKNEKIVTLRGATVLQCIYVGVGGLQYTPKKDLMFCARSTANVGYFIKFKEFGIL